MHAKATIFLAVEDQGIKSSRKHRQRRWVKTTLYGLEVQNESDEEMGSKSHLDKEIRKARLEAKKHSDLIDVDDSYELSVWSGSDEEKTLWTGDEMDNNDDDIPTEAHPNESRDTLMKCPNTEPEELSPKQARKLAVENALKKLKKGPDGRYTNMWEVMSDLDILIGAFENVVSGPEYAELRQGGPSN
ncbi:hypothetical protein Fmac_031679 [Flemingia macrophylla]|uniref:Uncharacterized protein n=1 Tax=Flemingia macrophylla TaxID=520843 RepID=A0ABD1L2Q9_9FABA